MIGEPGRPAPMSGRVRTGLRLLWTFLVAQAVFFLLLALFLYPGAALATVAVVLALLLLVARRRRRAKGVENR